eukprot:GHVU01077132.1.p1 GENE.GHVU01077132.1~~GHVU01077132.1.p1  ORF type:complete len:238 (-),score=0.88 GHVU01077132.1:638-1351(-)
MSLRPTLRQNKEARASMNRGREYFTLAVITHVHPRPPHSLETHPLQPITRSARQTPTLRLATIFIHAFIHSGTRKSVSQSNTSPASSHAPVSDSISHSLNHAFLISLLTHSSINQTIANSISPIAPRQFHTRPTNEPTEAVPVYDPVYTSQQQPFSQVLVGPQLYCQTRLARLWQVCMLLNQSLNSLRARPLVRLLQLEDRSIRSNSSERTTANQEKECTKVRPWLLNQQLAKSTLE